MNVAVIVIIVIAAILFLIFLGIGIFLWIRNRNPAPITTNFNNPYADALAHPSVWGPSSAGPDPERNVCHMYQFPTSVITIDGISTAIPPTPTLNPEIIDRLTPLPVPICLDVDQSLAQEVIHTCLVPGSTGYTGTTGIARCYRIDGTLATVDETEVYYTDRTLYNSVGDIIPTSCKDVPRCVGQLSLVSVNQYNNDHLTCLQRPGVTGSMIIAEPCDPSMSEQLFRITRVNPFVNPRTLSVNSPQNGLFAQILDRETGLCLRLGPPTTTTYVPSTVECTGGNQVIAGNSLVLGPCTSGASTMVQGTGTVDIEIPMLRYPGYDWMFLPSVTYCSVPGGCSGVCSGVGPGTCGSNLCVNTGTPAAPVCTSLCRCPCWKLINSSLIPDYMKPEQYCTLCYNTGADSAVCTANNYYAACATACASGDDCSCAGTFGSVTPQQIVYIGDLDFSTFPNLLLPLPYKGLAGLNAIIAWLIDQNAKSIYYGGGGTGVILKPLATNIQDCTQRGSTSQYINLPLYNIITHQEVCLADITNEICYGFS